MPLIAWILVFTALGSIVSAAFAAVFLLLSEQASARLLPHFASFATGALLGAALLALLPESIAGFGPAAGRHLGPTLIAGLGAFFIIEKLVLWKHAHSHDADADTGDGSAARHGHIEHAHAARDRAAGVLVLVGDSIHNALDGVLIAAAFLTHVHLGLITTFAVAAHEVPHRIGDFVILLHSGFSRGRAFTLNVATGIASVIGGLIAYAGLAHALHLLPYALALAAAGFLYIAVAGLIPALHRRADPRTSLLQVGLIGAGIALIAWAESWVQG